MTVLMVTGHRPDKLGGYLPEARAKLHAFALEHVARHKPAELVSGMALGWDTACALAALDLGIPLTAALPFAGQESRWPDAAQHIYRYILGRAARVEIVRPGGYVAWKMQERNEWMVKNSEAILALWNGSPGGTANCVSYAKNRLREVDNVWPQWAGDVFT